VILGVELIYSLLIDVAPKLRCDRLGFRTEAEWKDLWVLFSLRDCEDAPSLIPTHSPIETAWIRSH
jgi:hypothetical protein